MMKISPSKPDIYKSKPWNSQEEYFELAKQYRLYGLDLEAAIKKDRARVKIPLPVIRPPKQPY